MHCAHLGKISKNLPNTKNNRYVFEQFSGRIKKTSGDASFGHLRISVESVSQLSLLLAGEAGSSILDELVAAYRKDYTLHGDVDLVVLHIICVGLHTSLLNVVTFQG